MRVGWYVVLGRGWVVINACRTRTRSGCEKVYNKKAGEGVWGWWDELVRCEMVGGE